jgi:hypothetical protein
MSNPQDQQQDPFAAWKAEWPNYCRACSGWGCFQRYNAVNRETTITLCDVLPAGSCHRCGASDGIDPEDEVGRGCRHCGWSYDDGLGEGPQETP